MDAELESDILRCEVKRALGSITMNKATGGDEIPVELFQILKDDAVKMLHSICQQMATGLESSVFIPIPKKGNAKECPDYHTVALISHANKVMLKILQVRFQQYVNRELPDVQLGFRKRQRKQRLNCQHSWIIEKAREFQKIIHLCLTSYAKAFDFVVHNCGKLLKR